MKMMLKASIVLAIAFASVCLAVENVHEMCFNSCQSYGSSGNLEAACLRGCRLYGMIFLAHDRSIDSAEIAGLCSKSCSSTADAEAGACADGCAHQERVFRERQVSSHAAKLAVMLGLPSRPQIDSPAPYHARMFNRMPPPPPLAATATAWLHAVEIRVRPLPAGPDGRPRYWVEVSEHAVPLQVLTQRRVQLRDLPTVPGYQRHHHHWVGRARVGIRWAACALLAMSMIGLLWLCCSVFQAASPTSRVGATPSGALRIRDALRKRPLPSVQSGDILCVHSVKQPLLLLSEAESCTAKTVDTV